jgi:hypothetical protein
MASTASSLEITWTMVAVLALGFTAWIVDDNLRNFAAIRTAIVQGRAAKWGPRWWVAIASLVSSAAMFVVWLGFAVIGVLSMTTGPDSPEAYRVRISTLTGWVLVAMTLILAGIQAWQVYARTKIKPIAQSPSAVDEAADQSQYAADLVNALRPIEGDEPPPARGA